MEYTFPSSYSIPEVTFPNPDFLDKELLVTRKLYNQGYIMVK